MVGAPIKHHFLARLLQYQRRTLEKPKKLIRNAKKYSKSKGGSSTHGVDREKVIVFFQFYPFSPFSHSYTPNSILNL